MLIEQSCSFLYAVTPDPEVLAREVIAAKEAVSGEVVVEASTLAVITLLPDRAPALMACFTAVRLPRRSLVDIEAAWRDLARIPGFSCSLSYDTERNALVSKPVSLSEHQRLFRRVIAIDQTARQLLLTDLATTDRPLDGHQTWLSAVDLAAERLLPLWSDDVAIRSIATSTGITCFGTYALLTALTELSLIPETDGPLSSGNGIHDPAPHNTVCAPGGHSYTFGLDHFTNYGHRMVVLDRLILIHRHNLRLLGALCRAGREGDRRRILTAALRWHAAWMEKPPARTRFRVAPGKSFNLVLGLAAITAGRSAISKGELVYYHDSSGSYVANSDSENVIEAGPTTKNC